MRLHYSLMEAIVETLYIIFHERKMADKAIQAVLKSNKKWGARDRAFIAENTYDMIRWWRLLHYINETNTNNYSPTTIWKLLGIKLRLQDVDLPEIPEFRGLSRTTIKNRFEDSKSIRKVVQSIPDWLDEIGSEELGAKWEETIAALNKQAPMALRINTLKTSFDELKSLLGKEGHEILKVEGVESAAYLKERANIFSSPHFKAGMFEMQDPGSQLISTFLEVKPGMRVIDACAGAGGKALHLATMMQNKGVIIAMDTEEWKLEELKKRAKRNGIHNIDTRVVTGKVVKRLRGSADALLLDVPCSGLGVLRRNPDAKWKLQPEFIEEIKVKQAHIIQSYASMLKPGGKMVYATCSILPSENEHQVEQFLKNNPEYTLIKQLTISPAVEGFDGFYMALMTKT
jgi:16S rRNA (cytosine967-C5)-methyltransferase